MKEAEIRAKLKEASLSLDDALALVESELAVAPSAGAWNLRGDLIQLAERSPQSLEDVRLSYEQAMALAPADPEAYESLGHYYDAVDPQQELARHFYLEALSRGAGEECRIALSALIKESQD